MRVRIGLVAVLSLSALLAHAESVVVRDGREWRQLVETTDFTWDEVAAACPQDGTPCSGSIVNGLTSATVNVDGWIWARRIEVRDLFESVIQDGVVNFPSETSNYQNPDDPDINRALSGAPCWFAPTTVEPNGNNFNRYLHGWSATTAVSDLAAMPEMRDSPPGSPDSAVMYLVQSRTLRRAYGDRALGNWIFRPLDRTSALPMLAAVPDVNADGTVDLAVIRGAPTRAEVRSGANGALLHEIEFLDDSMIPVAVESLADTDGDGVPELAVLALRRSDGRGVVEIRNVSSTPAPRLIWFAACHRAIALAVVQGDADGNGVAELAVLSRRNRDGRGLVEVKNAYGPTNPQSIWASAGFTSSDLEIVDDADGNGVPEVAVLSTRDSDGRIVVEVKNAFGPTNPNAVWFMAGNTAIDLTVVPDADGNTVPEIAVLSSRDTDGRIVVETKNAAGTTNAYARWFAAGHTGLAVKAVPDADSTGIPEFAVLSTRDSDGRVLVEMKNARGVIVNTWSRWYPAGFTPRDLLVVDDLDANGFEELAVLLVRISDSRILVESQSAVGDPSKRDYWFSP